jgi:spermidine/putrescine transport system substrate-binding protein
MKRWLCTLLLALPLLASAKGVVNVYNWSNYMPASVLKQFTAETGIEVNYAQYDSNETMYAKLKGNPEAGYDVIFPSSYYIEKMASEGMLMPLDKRLIPNIKQLRPALMARPFDRHNTYSLPYVWGATGIVYNDQYHDGKQLHTWTDFWDSTYKNQLLLLNDNREVFSIALMQLGYSINDTNKQHIEQAYLLLKKLMPNVKVINTLSADNLFLDEDVTLGMNWNGDTYQVMVENPHIHFIYPNKHFVMWIDCVAVAMHAPHPKAAMQFINFIMSAKVAAEVSTTTGYSSPNAKALTMMPKPLRQNPTFNPSQKTLQRAEMQRSVGNAIRWYTYYWERLKLHV